MALKGETYEEQSWNFLKVEIGNNYGVAALMGNLSAESGLNPKNLENLCERRLKEAGKPYYTDEAYTVAVDSGIIERAEFLNPLPRKQYGYGLAQWTSVGRKAGLYDLAKSKGVSIGDLETQLEYLCKELRSSYKSVLSALKSATNVKDASDIVLIKFENPKNKSDSVKNGRAARGQAFYDKYATGGKKMGIKVGSARIDENGKLTGGKAGDQTGNEVCTQDYYMHSKGWYLLRPKDIAVANAIAKAMQSACDNDNIGYCQGHRTNVIAQLRKYGSMAAIVEKTEADCSSLVRGCCIEAGFDPGNFNTANEATSLEKTGKFEKRVSVTASTSLYNGDLLVTKTKGHTVAVVSGNPRSESSAGSVSGSSVNKGNTLIRRMQSAKSMDSNLAGTYKTTANLNLRYGPGKDRYDSIIILPAGTKCQCYGYYTAVSGVKWLYVVASVCGKQYTGFASMKYLKK
ncbi:MAG: phage tail tip lysozyme [Lachnospiraceae bacterium]|nr:phage tail tip lysozyme [Lachnospiraceae bacterium]